MARESRKGAARQDLHAEPGSPGDDSEGWRRERPLGIPTIRDRVVQTAAKLVLDPIFEADYEDSAHAYRPGRSALDAVAKVERAVKDGYTDVVTRTFPGTSIRFLTTS